MKVITYLCENCFEPYEFNPENKMEEYICPKCGEKLMYWSTEDIDPNTKKVINSCDEIDRKIQNPGKPINSEFSHLTQPTVTCPYCQSTNVSKIGTLGRMASVGFWGFASGKVGKHWHCKNCKSDF